MPATLKGALPPKLRTPARLPRGPEWLHLPVQKLGGPGDPPPGFVGATNSAVEWMVYWALSKVFGRPEDPRKPPFDGAWPDWTYQKGRDFCRYYNRFLWRSIPLREYSNRAGERPPFAQIA